MRSSVTDWSLLPLSRAATDRAAHRRDEPGLIERLRADPSTRVVVVRGASVALEPGGPGEVARLDLLAAPRLASGARDEGAAEGLWLFLGEDDDGAYLALVLAPASDDVVDISGVVPARPYASLEAAQRLAPLRDVGHLLGARDAGLATTAVALAAWHASARRCPACGEALRPARAGWAAVCVDDGSEHFPRTDPAVIMAVVDADDRLLLGHAAQWPERRFSTLAGFVEAGESAEGAVRREVLEEVGVRVGDVGYRTSQPWPFPRSLMLGFRAQALTTALDVDGEEVTDARWFTRAELARDVASGAVLLPMRASVARGLIEEWFGAALDG